MSFRAACLSLGLVFFVSLSGACGGPDPAPDGGVAEDAAPACVFLGLDWSHATIGVTVGATRDAYLDLERDYCLPFAVTLETEGTGSISGLPPTTEFEPGGTTRSPISITGVAEGELTIVARGVDRDGTTFEARLAVSITSAEIPPCTGSAAGAVAPGGSLEVAGGGTLDGARISLPAGAARDDLYHVDPFTASIGCATDQLPAGYLPLGPAVRFASDDAWRFAREIDLSIPIRLALLPSHAHRGHVEIAYVGPGADAPRIVPIASPVFEGSAGAGVLRFLAPRLGTYQAVARADAPRTRSRTLHYRGILGFSMGGSGAGRIGVGNPELFDFVAPLGGPTDWIYMLEYMRRYHLGGFCSEARRQVDLEDGILDECAAASEANAPPRPELYEHHQHFEHWWYEDEYTGQGGTFDRREYIEIFRDLAAMFGNPNTDRTATETEPNVTTPGVPDADRFLPDSERCMPSRQHRIAGEPATPDTDPSTGFFDDEYNPDGRYPVITFCDGQERTILGTDDTDFGNWDPTGAPRTPFEVGLAVDIDGDGLRDPGEPVIRNGREPFDDVGADGVASADEPGHHPLTNPDPAGDDYDFQYNPSGTEQNWERDEGEPYLDVGLDGVAGTPQLAAGGFDSGEGNGVFDRARGAARMIESSPRQLVRSYSEERVRQFDVIADGGVRDLFNWVVMGHHTMGAFAASGLPVRFYNGHAALHLDGRSDFDFTVVPYEELGPYAFVRYGSIDATEADKILGDGGHAGTTEQITHRVFSSLALMDRRWPNGDRRRVRDQLCPAISSSCDHVNSFTVDFESAEAGRTGPMSVVLPPGYFDPEYADYRYPVVYFLHGYGMEPEDLSRIGLLLWNYMTAPTLPEARRVQKMIFVFPDGRCREQECLNGTFYTDAPESTPNGAQMQTFLLDFMDYVDATYRTRGAETVEVAD
jgi:hypothetical protein